MQYIETEVKNHIAIITISLEKQLNILNRSLLEELGQTLDQLDSDVFCVVITGAGEKSFVAGADIIEMKDFDVQQAADFGAFGNRIFQKIEKLGAPVIAAVNGYALGGGFELALACDIRLASENAVFGFPETSLGIIPGFGGTQRLPRLINVSAAKKLMFTAARIQAYEAYKLGIVDEVVPLSGLMDRSIELAAQIAKRAPIAVFNLKKAVNIGINLSLDNALETETEYFAQCFASEDQKNAMTVFLNKEKPQNFLNR